MKAKIQEYSSQLRLGNLAEIYDQVEFQYRGQYLAEIMKLLVEQRQANRARRLVRQAGFPAAKTLEGYEFDHIEFPAGLDADTLLELSFISKRENLLLLGAVGTGKTHLAVALGVKACMQGKRVSFYRATDLTNELMELHQAGRAGKLIKKIAAADLFILDEVGYVPFSKRAAELLFTVVANSYEQQSIIATSNLEFGRWNEVFGDDRLTAALIDRLVHHAHILTFTGQSYRLKQALTRRDAAQGNHTKD